MNQEFEVKFLDVDVPKLEEKLRALGATKVGDFFYRSGAYDYPGFTLDQNNSWVRLRDEGDKVTLAYKHRLGVSSSAGNDEGMEEIEFEVEDFSTAEQFLLKIGLILKFAQEKKRTRWEKDGIVYDIDTWPRLKPYLEVEADSEEDMKRGIALIGFDLKDAKRFSTTQVYELNGIRDKDYIKLGFDEFIKRT